MTDSEVNILAVSPARLYDFLLGGKDNYAVDRAAAQALLQEIPTAELMARANRAFLRRAVVHLVKDLRVAQFLDVGSGLPTRDNVHEVAQRIDPTARVVYVDKDPMVAAHARALQTSGKEGRVAFVQADATDPAAVLASRELVETLDLGQPVALMLVSFLMYFPDDIAHRIVSTLARALPAGSYLTLSHPTADFLDPHAAEQAQKVGAAKGLTFIPRTRARVEDLITSAGMKLCEPGVATMLNWRPDMRDISARDISARDTAGVHYYVGMGRTP